jgi:hypothetical protein
MSDAGGGRKRSQPAWMQDHEIDTELAADDDDSEEPAPRARRAPKPKAAPIKLSVTCGPSKPSAVDDKDKTKEEKALLARYAQLRAALDAQASSHGHTPRAEERQEAQNAERMAAAVAALKQDSQADERKAPTERKLPSMRRSNHVSSVSARGAAAPEVGGGFRDAADESGPQLDLGALWPGQQPTGDS